MAIEHHHMPTTMNCSGGNLQALCKNGREGSLEIFGTKAVNCSGGNLQAWPTEKITHTHTHTTTPRFYRNYAGEKKKKKTCAVSAIENSARTITSWTDKAITSIDCCF
jgi:hypothetical protein